MMLSDSFPEYSVRGDYYYDEEVSTSVCEMCRKEVADSGLSQRGGSIRINGVFLCRRCFEHSTVESICDITDTPVDYIAECISD